VLDRDTEVRRVLDRYLVEIVETYDLCPWARSARTTGELAVAILWQTPTLAQWVDAAQRLLAQPTTRVAMVLAPELAATPGELRAIRDDVTKLVPQAGVAHFHPDAPLDLATAARLVPFLRRSPDPMLQLVPFAVLDAVRPAASIVDRTYQAAMIQGGYVAKPDLADRIADTNHATVSAQRAAIVATLDDIRRDRLASYARAGISACR
jgi:hypothetical protein